MTGRDIRQQRRAAQERDDSWQEQRNDDLADDDVPADEYPGMDEFADMAREYRG